MFVFGFLAEDEVEVVEEAAEVEVVRDGCYLEGDFFGGDVFNNSLLPLLPKQDPLIHLPNIPLPLITLQLLPILNNLITPPMTHNHLLYLLILPNLIIITDLFLIPSHHLVVY